MKKIILIALSILAIFSALSCTKFTRNNPFDPAVKGTEIFYDDFESYSVGPIPPPPWIMGGASAFLNITLFSLAGPPVDKMLDFYVGNTVSSVDYRSAIRPTDNILKNKVSMDFTLKASSGANHGRLMVGLADSSKVYGLFGFSQTALSPQFTKHSENGGFTQIKQMPINLDVECRMVIDLDSQMYNVWIKLPAASEYEELVIDEPFPSGLPDSFNHVGILLTDSTLPGMSMVSIGNLDNLRVTQLP